jgi:hypothetical protein
MGYPAPGMMPPGQGELSGQYGGPPPGYPMPPPGYSPMPGGYGQVGMMSPDAHGAYGSAPPEMMYGGGMPGGGGCQYCGGMGCDMCSTGHGGYGGGHGANGLLGDLLGCVAPYPDGGCAAVRWFDFSLDFMFLQREGLGDNVDIASLGVNGPIVLSTDDLDFDDEGGIRFTGQFQVGPGSSAEFTYYGLNYYTDTASAVRAGPLPGDGLYSVLSDFGLVPAGGFDETDNADVTTIGYNSTFDNYEVNFRQRWMAPNCRYQGSWLLGVRFFELDENFNLFTSSAAGSGDPLAPATMNYHVRTTNALTGIQGGGDVWICLLPGLRLGAEAKAGVFGNHANADTEINVNTNPLPADNTFVELNEDNDIAFVANADIMFTYRLNYQWTLRGGYHFLFVDGVALATDNFNTEPPLIFNPPPAVGRVPFIDDEASVFYHGWTVGAEFMW